MLIRKPMWEGISKECLHFVIKSTNQQEEDKIDEMKKYLSLNNALTFSEKCIEFALPLNITEIDQCLYSLEKIYLDDKKNNCIEGKITLFKERAFSDSKPIMQIIEGEEMCYLESLRDDLQIRVTAFLNIIYCLEGIIKTTFDDMGQIAKILGVKKINYGKRRELRRKEIKKFITWRNKVFGHTSYQNPKQPNYQEGEEEKEDSQGTQATSLLYFSARFYSYSDDKKRICIGGSSIGQGADSIFLEQLDIVKDYPKIVDHFKEWESMFLDLFSRIKEIPKEKIAFKGCQMKEQEASL